MKKFKCTVTRTDEYIIEIDEKIFGDEKFNEEFRKTFYPFFTVEDHVDHLAQFQARFGTGFIEGYGHVKRDGKTGHPECVPCKGINIIIESEDDDCNVEIEDVTDE